jgi:ankyrin repeat protein
MKGKTAECVNLIRSGANVNTCDLNEICPLSAAATTGSVETVELLIKMKAIIDFKDRIGHTPLIKVIRCVFVFGLVCVGGMIACPHDAGARVQIMLQMKFLTACQ